jgi:hypothetical protein
MNGYSIDELTAEVGRMILFILAGAAWSYLMLVLMVD